MIIKIDSQCVSDTVHQEQALLAAKQLEAATGQSCFAIQAPNHTFCALTQGQMNCLRLPDTYKIYCPDPDILAPKVIMDKPISIPLNYRLYSRKRHDLSKLITDTAKANGEKDAAFQDPPCSEIRDLQNSLDAAISILTDNQLTELTKILIERKILPQEKDLTDDWKYEVANGDTKLGYVEWLEHQKEMNERDATEYFTGRLNSRLQKLKEPHE